MSIGRWAPGAAKCRSTKARLKSLSTCSGADEVFAGYHWYPQVDGAEDPVAALAALTALGGEIVAEATTVEPKPVAPPEPESATDGARREPLPPLRPATGAERMLRDDGVEEISPVSGMTSALRARAAAQAAQKS